MWRRFFSMWIHGLDGYRQMCTCGHSRRACTCERANLTLLKADETYNIN